MSNCKCCRQLCLYIYWQKWCVYQCCTCAFYEELYTDSHGHHI